MIKASLQSVYSNPRYNTIREWVKLIAITGGGQAIVQATGLLSGILIIRLLPMQEYAYYTIANTMLGTMTLLSDGGISTGVMAQGGKVWQDKDKLGAVLATGLDLRRKFATGSLIVSIPILLYLLIHQGASWLTSMLIVLALIPAFYATLSDSLLEIVPKLHQDIKSLQVNQINVSLGRLLLSGLSVFLFPWTFIALLASGIPRIYGNIQLKKIALGFINDYPKKDITVRSNIIKIVKRILPGNIYYCLSGQVTVWLIALFGSTKLIAEVGALGRLLMFLNLFSILFSTLIIPRFARLPNKKNILGKRYIQAIGILILIYLIIILLTCSFPTQILKVLGEEYNGINRELFLSTVGGCINLLAGGTFSLYISRGWIMHPGIAISISILPIIVGPVLLDISTINGILLLNIFIGSVSFILHTVYIVLKIIKLQ